MANPNDLVANLNLNITGSASEAPKEDDRKFNKGKARGKLSENIHKVNFKSIAKLGLGIRQLRMTNEIVGAYTGDRITQRTVSTGITLAQYGVGIAYAGPVGLAYAAGDVAFRTVNFQIKRSRDNRMARAIRNLSGNESRNHSRMGGDKLWLEYF